MIKKGNPLSLSTLFFTEMWERFSYYGMRALLVLYLVNSLNYSESEALHIYAVHWLGLPHPPYWWLSC